MTKSSKKAPAKAPAKAAAKPAAKPEKIGKTQMVDLLADKAGLTKKQAAEAIDGLNDIITGALKTGKTVGLPGLGTFSVKSTAARQGVRPGTNEKINIPAGKKVSFKVASNLKTEI